MPKIEEIPGAITAVPGMKAGGINCGIKADRRDLALIYSTVVASCAGVMTTNRVKAAPLLINQKIFRKGKARAIIVNSGNANVLNGKQGLADAEEMAALAAANLGIPSKLVVVASTGVIGEPLPMGKIRRGIPRLTKTIRKDGGSEAARAIMTTDTVKKELAVRYHFGNKSITIGGMAKGSGMIHPRMATMLAFIATDAAISPMPLKKLLKNSADQSFNTISVDGDMSTNDMVVLLANGMNGKFRIDKEGERLYRGFQEALNYVTSQLAEMIVKDGEGATRLIRVRVKGAKTSGEARGVAEAVANSNLVKCAVHGGDPNVGRIIAAVGYAGYPIDPVRIDVYLDQFKVIRNGERINFDKAKAKRAFRGKEVIIAVDLKRGKGKTELITCDLSPKYVKINAHYRT